ncbi:MAG TPA: GNAT family N-acetyltransferase [Stellaceae bacterium]|jgi:GNAT superfamily N-acetyltransferase|nr:GNAT family N-acetyltransferase [Stellaceae bacterium]
MAIEIRPLAADEVEAAERLRRLAFGTLFGLPDPLSFRGDAALLPARRQAFPDGVLAAVEDGALLGVATANHWGSLGVFGPIVIDPAQWRRGIARQLLEATMPIFDRWGSRVTGLFTWPERVTHVRLYQSAGFWPRHLIAIMARPVTAPSPVPEALSFLANPADRQDLLRQCAALTGSIYEGLDLTREIELVSHQNRGDTILLTENSRIVGLAICHHGAGSEAGSGGAYVKFAAVRSGPEAPRRLERLLAACSDFAHRRGAKDLSAGICLGRMEAYRLLLGLGFRSMAQGVAMHRPWIEAYDRPDIFALDDWR